MSGPAGIGSFTFRLGEPAQAAPGKASADLTAALGGSNQGRGVVVAAREGLAVRIANVQLPLPASAALAAGTRVEITLIEAEGGMQVQVRPESASPDGPRAAGTRPLIATVLETLGALSPSNLNAATGLLPAGVRLSEETVRLLLTLFVSRGQAGRDLASIATHIRAAISAGALSPDLANALLSLLDEASASDERQFRAALEKALHRARNSLEARIAGALARSDLDQSAAFKGDLRAQLLQFRDNAALVEFLSGKGILAEFRKAVDGLIDRFSGAHLQNALAVDHDYFFLELPLHSNAAMDSVQIHFFTNGKSGGADGQPDDATVVLDLSTRHLGDLWVSLRMQGDACLCRFKAAREDVIAAIRTAQADLAEALAGVGFRQADIHVSSWDGDRLREVSGLMRRLTGLDTTA